MKVGKGVLMLIVVGLLCWNVIEEFYVIVDLNWYSLNCFGICEFLLCCFDVLIGGIDGGSEEE